jgi:hypothetical protein
MFMSSFLAFAWVSFPCARHLDTVLRKANTQSRRRDWDTALASAYILPIFKLMALPAKSLEPKGTTLFLDVVVTAFTHKSDTILSTPKMVDSLQKTTIISVPLRSSRLTLVHRFICFYLLLRTRTFYNFIVLIYRIQSRKTCKNRSPVWRVRTRTRWNPHGNSFERMSNPR